MTRASIALNRFGYGLRAGEEASRIPSGDPAANLLDQLRNFDPRPGALSSRPDTSGEAGELLAIIRNARAEARRTAAMEGETPGMEPERASSSGQRLKNIPPEYRKKLIEARGRHRSDIVTRTAIAVNSPTPFAERLVHFWSNHFSVSTGKQGTPFEVGNHEFYAVRPYVLGKFSDLLKAAVLHPAMLLYLDQYQSVGPNSPFQMRRQRRNSANIGGGGNRDRGLNENFAREVLELHTLGVDGGYTQADVTEFARALTGWTLPGLSRISQFSDDQPGGAAFAALAHEPGVRTVMGRSYPDTGAGQAIDILGDLAAHPATARFIATKLARHFTADQPDANLVARLERDFLDTGGDLTSLARTLVEAPESWKGGEMKFRQPYEWLVSVLRFTGTPVFGEQRLHASLRQLGQVPWSAPSPAGFDDVTDSWAGPEALLLRVELAEQIARKSPADRMLERARAAFPGTLSANTQDWLSRAESGSQALALLLVSPEMMRR